MRSLDCRRDIRVAVEDMIRNVLAAELVKK